MYFFLYITKERPFSLAYSAAVRTLHYVFFFLHFWINVLIVSFYDQAKVTGGKIQKILYMSDTNFPEGSSFLNPHFIEIG